MGHVRANKVVGVDRPGVRGCRHERHPSRDDDREQFLAWEERQELRFEFDGVGPVAMVGGTLAHGAIQANLMAALGAALRGKTCRVHGNLVKIAPAGSIRYPDAFVVCTPQNARATVAADPVAVFEILSPGTAPTDMITKNAEYRATPSIQRYVLIEQSSYAAMFFFRRGEDWVSETFIGLDATLRLPEIDVELALADIYANVPAEDAS